MDFQRGEVIEEVIYTEVLLINLSQQDQSVCTVYLLVFVDSNGILSFSIVSRLK